MNRDLPGLGFCEPCNAHLPGSSGGRCPECTAALRKTSRRSARLNVRGLAAYATWRRAVLMRDGWTCVLCDDIGAHVDHHPVTLAELIRRNAISTNKHAIDCAALWDPQAGRVLCAACHAEQPTTPRSLAKTMLRTPK